MISFSAPPIFIFIARAGFAANKEKGRKEKTIFFVRQSIVCTKDTP